MRARLLLLAAALAAFGGSLGSGFHFDDYAIFPSGGLEPPWWLETRPLTFLTFWLNRRLSGTGAIGYHAFNLALHMLALDPRDARN
ncbi:MAG TPA: hypothetical protein VLW65_02995 [Bryobacteraceae bacterium]|nr:hypothetical protein [Bryobacteraceae bacterium]